MRTLVPLLLAAAPLMAQFSGLATDDTGSRVWFSSALRLRGTNQSVTPKIFSADALGNIQLIAQGASGMERSTGRLIAIVAMPCPVNHLAS
jgi:hypothetical protein